MDELTRVWNDLVICVRRFRSLVLAPGAYPHLLLLARKEARSVVEEALDKWDDVSGLRTLASKLGSRFVYDLVDQLVETALKKYLGEPDVKD